LLIVTQELSRPDCNEKPFFAFAERHFEGYAIWRRKLVVESGAKGTAWHFCFVSKSIPSTFLQKTGDQLKKIESREGAFCPDKSIFYRVKSLL
jgi:hypothetical protein